MIRSVLFDLDDTLYNEREFVEGGLQIVASHISQRYNLDYDRVYALLLEVLGKHGRGQVFDIGLKTLNLYDSKIIPELVDIYRSHTPRLKLFPEVEGVLGALEKDGYRLGMITDGNVEVQENKIEALGISEYFECIVFTHKYGIEREKPDTLAYSKALKKLDVSPEQSLFVGDNPYKDFISAKKIGMPTIRVMRGRYKTIELEIEYEADFRIATLREIFGILNTL